jgi:hypothetical protein
MSDLIKQIVTSVVDDVVKQLLGKSHGRSPSKRKKRQTRAAASFTAKKPGARSKVVKPARKQTSRRRSTTSRSKQRSR